MAPRALIALAAAWTSVALVAACASGVADNSYGDDGTGDSAAASEASTDRDGNASDGRASDASGKGDGPRSDSGGGKDGAAADGGSATDSGTSGGDGSSQDSASGSDAPSGGDTSTAMDTGTVTGHDATTISVLTGGPCVSGATGATAIRIGWVDGGGQAMVQYDVEGLPDTSKDMADAYGYQIGFTPQYVDPYLAQGGVAIDSSDFIDIAMTTAGITSITSATLSIYGRSYDTTASGSFNWQTFDGTNATPVDFVSNSAPYQWYSADMTTEIGPGENNVLVRIKAGPSSGALVVNQVEICMVAN
jgi:hypothetical protein